MPGLATLTRRHQTPGSSGTGAPGSGVNAGILCSDERAHDLGFMTWNSWLRIVANHGFHFEVIFQAPDPVFTAVSRHFITTKRRTLIETRTV